LNAAQQASVAASAALEAANATMDGARFKFGMVAFVDADQLKLFKALNAKAVIPGAAIQGHLQRTLSVVDLHDAMRSTVSGLHRSSYGYGIAALVMMSASLGHLNQQIKKAPVEERGLLQANFAAGVAVLIGDSAILLGEVGAKLPWFSKTLAEPMGRWMFNASKRAELLGGGGRWMSGLAGILIGALTFYQGYRDYPLSKVYGTSMMIAGIAGAAGAFLFIIGSAIPLAILLTIFAALLTVVVAWMVPNEVERWLDKAMHFGNNESGAFDSWMDQSKAMQALRVL